MSVCFWRLEPITGLSGYRKRFAIEIRQISNIQISTGVVEAWSVGQRCVTPNAGCEGWLVGKRYRQRNMHIVFRRLVGFITINSSNYRLPTSVRQQDHLSRRKTRPFTYIVGGYLTVKVSVSHLVSRIILILTGFSSCIFLNQFNEIRNETHSMVHL